MGRNLGPRTTSNHRVQEARLMIVCDGKNCLEGDYLIWWQTQKPDHIRQGPFVGRETGNPNLKAFSTKQSPVQTLE